MDSRDFAHEEMPEVVHGRYLEKMYELQKALLEDYIGIEKLPMYPINVHTRENQIILKDFIARITEELSEGYESLTDLGKMILNGFIVESPKSPDRLRLFKSHWQNIGEEWADSLHFFLELMIYVNIQPEDINSWVQKTCKEFGFTVNLDLDTLSLCMVLGKKNNPDYWDAHTCSKYDLWHHLLTTNEEKVYLPLRRVHLGEIESSRVDLWDIAQSLNIARNCLKNKPWKQTEEMTNERLFQEKVVEAFSYFCGYLAHMGLTSEQVYHTYVLKNKVNVFRQKSKY